MGGEDETRRRAVGAAATHHRQSSLVAKGPDTAGRCPTDARAMEGSASSHEHLTRCSPNAQDWGGSNADPAAVHAVRTLGGVLVLESQWSQRTSREHVEESDGDLAGTDRTGRRAAHRGNP